MTSVEMSSKHSRIRKLPSCCVGDLRFGSHDAATNEIGETVENAVRATLEPKAIETTIETPSIRSRRFAAKALNLLERAKGLKPTTPSLGSSYSTN